MATSRKVVVTNEAALQLKYGHVGLGLVMKALRSLIVADLKRGVSTSVVRLDSAADMSAFGAKCVRGKSAKGHKDAIDAVCRATSPDYVMIMGASDVVPHQRLRNPLRTPRKPKGDGDLTVPSDLPYACAQIYSREPQAFLAPSRAVSRLPDLVNANHPDHLLSLLAVAAGARTRATSDYNDYFAVSAKVWAKSTRATLHSVFGGSKNLALSPKEGPAWTITALKPRVHLINCHGAPGASEFYGEEGNDYPVAHDAKQLAGIQDGTVAAAECCYGAELYDPSVGLPMGICHAYLKEGAYGFLGSSTIAYGPFDPPNSSADLLCRYFLEIVLRGEPIGSALLEARQRFIRHAGPLDPIDLKTVAQFYLLGDPSLQAIAPKPTGTSRGVKGLRGHQDLESMPDAEARRQKRERDARRLAASASAPIPGGPPASQRVRNELDRAAAERGVEIEVRSLSSFTSRSIARRSAAARRKPPRHSLRAGKERPKSAVGPRFYVAFTKSRVKSPTDTPARISAEVVYVAREFDGKVEVRELQQKGGGPE